MKMTTKPLEILLVEDNKGDIGLITEFFSDAKVLINLHIAEDGEEALRFLYDKDKFLGSKLPDLIILDLNLPKKDGREVLREIKENSNLKNIPIIILTFPVLKRTYSKLMIFMPMLISLNLLTLTNS